MAKIILTSQYTQTWLLVLTKQERSARYRHTLYLSNWSSGCSGPLNVIFTDVARYWRKNIIPRYWQPGRTMSGSDSIGDCWLSRGGSEDVCLGSCRWICGGWLTVQRSRSRMVQWNAGSSYDVQSGWLNSRGWLELNDGLLFRMLHQCFVAGCPHGTQTLVTMCSLAGSTVAAAWKNDGWLPKATLIRTLCKMAICGYSPGCWLGNSVLGENWWSKIWKQLLMHKVFFF